MENVKILPTEKELSSFGGLKAVSNVVEGCSLRDKVISFLPKLKSGGSRRYQKFHNFLFGFVCGAECLDDMEMLRSDSGFDLYCQRKAYHPKTYGDFLRSFKKLDLTNLNKVLIDLNLSQCH